MILKNPKTNQKCQRAYINFLSNSELFLQKEMPSVLDFVFLPCEVAIIYFLFASNFVSDLRLFLSESVPTLYIRRKERCRSTFRIDLCIISLFSDQTNAKSIFLCQIMHRILMLMVVFIRGYPGTDLKGGIEGGPNNWAIVLNLTPQNLVVGGARLWARSNQIRRQSHPFRKLKRFCPKNICLEMQ